MSEVTKLVLAITAGVSFVFVIAFSAVRNSNQQINKRRQWEYDKEHCVEWSREETLPRKCLCYDVETCAKEAKQ